MFFFLLLRLLPMRAYDLVFCLPDVQVDRAGDKFRNVEGEERGVVRSRILLGQEKWFGGLALLVQRGNIRAGIKTVAAPAAEDKPPAIAAPTMIAFYIGTVHFRQRAGLSCLKIQEP